MSGFTDSPEDLIARAKRIAAEGKIVIDRETGESIAVPPAVCLELDGIARALETERGSRAHTAAIIRDQNIRFGQAEALIGAVHRRRLRRMLIVVNVTWALLFLLILWRHR